jgi:hypothetical protein
VAFDPSTLTVRELYILSRALLIAHTVEHAIRDVPPEIDFTPCAEWIEQLQLIGDLVGNNFGRREEIPPVTADERTALLTKLGYYEPPGVASA